MTYKKMTKAKKLAMRVGVLEREVASLADGTLGAEGADLVWKMGRHLEQTRQLLEQLMGRVLEAPEEDEK